MSALEDQSQKNLPQIDNKNKIIYRLDLNNKKN